MEIFSWTFSSLERSRRRNLKFKSGRNGDGIGVLDLQMIVSQSLTGSGF